LRQVPLGVAGFWHGLHALVGQGRTTPKVLARRKKCNGMARQQARQAFDKELEHLVLHRTDLKRHGAQAAGCGCTITLLIVHRFCTPRGPRPPGVHPMLFDTFSARTLHLANHMVMSPMTRSRAMPQHTPDELMATYYGQRATAGLIVTEGTSPSPNGLGYLIEQFLNPLVNLRTDAHGGSMEARNRLALEIASATASAIGNDRVGIRLSPYGVLGGTGELPEVQTQHLSLAQSLSKLGLICVHLVDHASMGAPPVPADFKLKLRASFNGVFILSGGFDHASAKQTLIDKHGDLIAFGRAFLANPDLVARVHSDATLNTPDQATSYVPGAKGYTDCPALAA